MCRYSGRVTIYNSSGSLRCYLFIQSPLRRPFDQQLPDITEEEVHQVMAVVSSELQQLLK